MLLFIDESGTDEKIAPCVVLGGITISEENLWQFEQAVGLLQREVFGVELSEVGIEIKGSRLLKPKTFRHAAQAAPIEAERRRSLARDFLIKGFEESKKGISLPRTKDEFTAYGQAATEFVDRLLGVAALYGVKTFGSIVKKNCPSTLTRMLFGKTTTIFLSVSSITLKPCRVINRDWSSVMNLSPRKVWN